MKKRFVITFPPEAINKPITYNLIKEYDIKINILNADITSGEQGRLLLEMESDKENINRGVKYIRSNNLECVPIDKKINYNKSACVNCGSCTSVCFAGALTLDRVNWEIKFDAEKCVVCELCTKACPLRLFNIDFKEN